MSPRALVGVVVAVLLLAVDARAETAPAPSPSIDDALAGARKSGTPLVLDFYTDWCGPCRDFEAKILPDPGVKAALAGTTFLRYDAEKGVGVAAAKRYRVDGYPTFVIVDPRGEVVARVAGLPDAPAGFVTFVERGVALSLDEATVTARVADARTDARGLLAAARWLAAHRRGDEAIAAYARAGKADKGGKLGVAASAEWEAIALQAAREHRHRLAEAAAAFAERWPAAGEADDAAELALAAGGLPAARTKKLWHLLLARHAGDRARLNALAYTAIALGDLDAALAAAKRAVELGGEDPAVHDTLAEVLHYRGARAEAVAEADRAITLNRDARMDAMLRENRARFAADGPIQPSPDVEAEKARRARQVAAATGMAGGEADPAEAEADPAEAEATMRGFGMNATRLYRAAGQTCAAQAGKLKEVYVRVELPAAGGKPARVVVLEPDASAGLKKCLVDALAVTPFPAPPPTLGGRYTGSLVLRVAGKPPT